MGTREFTSWYPNLSFQFGGNMWKPIPKGYIFLTIFFWELRIGTECVFLSYPMYVYSLCLYGNYWVGSDLMDKILTFCCFFLVWRRATLTGKCCSSSQNFHAKFCCAGYVLWFILLAPDILIFINSSLKWHIQTYDIIWTSEIVEITNMLFYRLGTFMKPLGSMLVSLWNMLVWILLVVCVQTVFLEQVVLSW